MHTPIDVFIPFFSCFFSLRLCGKNPMLQQWFWRKKQHWYKSLKTPNGKQQGTKIFGLELVRQMAVCASCVWVGVVQGVPREQCVSLGVFLYTETAGDCTPKPLATTYNWRITGGNFSTILDMPKRTTHKTTKSCLGGCKSSQHIKDIRRVQGVSHVGQIMIMNAAFWKCNQATRDTDDAS